MFYEAPSKTGEPSCRLCDERTKDVWEFVSNGKANEDTVTEILLHLKKAIICILLGRKADSR